MLHSFQKKVTLKNRTLCFVLTLVMLVSLLTVGIGTVASAASVTYYFDTSNDTAWNPGSGEQLRATFTNSSGAQVASGTTYTLQAVAGESNLYSVTAPDGAANMQVYLVRSGYTMLSSTPAAGKKRVFFNNTKPQWTTPMAYAWSDDGNDAPWTDNGNHGSAMTRVGSTNFWYYDTARTMIIFNDNKNAQTGDITIPTDSYNPVFSSATGSAWDSTAYYKKYAEISLSSRPSGANDVYAMSDGSLKFSKYAYTGSDPRGFSPGSTVYLYAPNWSEAYVYWDLDDPYQYKAPMTNEGDGFFSAIVPTDARLRFYYNAYASSNATTVPDGFSEPCYTMKNNANMWCEKKNAVNGEATDFAAPIESLTSHNTGSAFWVDATYYDYLSDRELEYGWLNPIQAGTGFNGSSNDWFEFKNFNSKINSVAAANKSNWTYPLYFGNICGTYDAFDGNAAHDDYKGKNFTSNIGYMGPNITGLTNFDYAVNDSNGLWVNGMDADKSPDYHYSVRGLVDNTLTDGSLTVGGGTAAPYFDSTWLSSQSIGKSVRSSFPFRTSDLGNGITKYSFNSEGATDNVFFNWSGTTPTSVGYGQGTGYGIIDGIKYFMDPTQKDPDTGNTYSSKNYYGIFPFNNKNGNGGNNNIDYGFGIKMDMDFRVPEGGKLANGSDVTFKYSGDDDLWVYLSEYDSKGALVNSQLVLDLGGNHKKAEGSINFATMTSTAKKSMLPTANASYDRNAIYLVNSNNWSEIWVWAWNNTSDGKWYKALYDSASGCYKVGGDWGPWGETNGDRFDSKTKFLCCKAQNDWGSKTAEDTIVNHLGKKTYTDNLRYAADFAVTYTYNTTNTTSFTFPSLSGTGSDGDYASTGVATLDPNKTYHMTVFYMERGMLESNCMIEFTMTPASNDLKVKKTIDTEEVNVGLQDAVKEQNFSFTNSDNGGSSANTTAKYTMNGGTTSFSVAGNGSYGLSDQDVADFDNQYATGSSIVVSETKPSSGIKYKSTAWEVVDNVNGRLIKNGSYTYSGGSYQQTTKTDAFDFKNDDNSYVTRQVNFVNTPQVQDLILQKKVISKDNEDVDDVNDEFWFELLVDLNGGSDYQPYKLKYDITTDGDTESLFTTATGQFRFSIQDTVTIKGLPVGATYSLRELTATGYKPYAINSSSNNFDGLYTGTLSGSDQTLVITNQQQPVSTQMKVRKFISMPSGAKGLYESGSLFTFKAEGLDSVEYDLDSNSDPVMSVSALGMSKEISKTDANGEVVFGNSGGSDKFLMFTRTGTYIFKIYETSVNGDDSVNFYNSDLSLEKVLGHDRMYLVRFDVTADPQNARNMIVSDPVYYNYDGSEISADTFDSDNEIISAMPEFNNPAAPASVTINKTDGANDKLSDVYFNIYKVDGDGGAIDEANAVGEAKKTDANGVAKFSDLDIYQKNANGKYSAEPEYQWYALQETRAKDGYAKSTVIKYFTLPMEDSSTHEPKYDITFDYVNGAIKNPSTAGPGVVALRTSGCAIILLASALLAYYVLRGRKKAYQPAHVRKSR